MDVQQEMPEDLSMISQKLWRLQLQVMVWEQIQEWEMVQCEGQASPVRLTDPCHSC